MNKSKLYSIGEMSFICSLTVKTLRFYDETGLLPAEMHDSRTGYRYYSSRQVESARKIILLKNLGFQLEEIRPCLNESFTREQLKTLIQEKKQEVSREIKQMQNQKNELTAMEQFLNEENTMKKISREQTIEIKQIPPLLVASLRYRGRYGDVGEYIGRLYKSFGRVSCGTVFCRYHDDEYKENDAEIEVCLPVKKKLKHKEITVCELERGQFICLNHIGPYEKLGEAYQALADYCKSHNQKTTPPSREIYHKGPGLFFRGNPEKYITEIQLKIDS